jgi:hypothetical protein
MEPATEQQIDALRIELARALATSYRFVLAYPNSLETAEQDASALIALIYESGLAIAQVSA